LENLVFVHADTGFVDGHSRQHFGVVVHVLADAFDDGVDLFLRERFECRLGDSGFGDELLHLGISDDRWFLDAFVHGDVLRWFGRTTNYNWSTTRVVSTFRWTQLAGIQLVSQRSGVVDDPQGMYDRAGVNRDR